MINKNDLIQFRASRGLHQTDMSTLRWTYKKCPRKKEVRGTPKGFIRVPPEDFRGIWWSKKIIMVTKLILYYILDAKDTSTFWRIKKYLEKQPIEDIHKLYDYLFTLHGKTPMSIGDLYKKAEEHRKGQMTKVNKEKSTASQYKEISIDEVLKL